MSSSKTLQDLTDDDIRDSQWYYEVELRPGIYTGGKERYSAAMVRELLDGIDVTGARSLDIGAQEGMLSVSLARRGASTVVAYDRLDLTPRIGLVKEAYGVDFDYLHSMQLAELSDALKRAGHTPFDVVVFAGVLYHMIDPLAGLGIARSFLRENGLLLIETAAIVSDEMVLYFNAAGRHQPFSCYFLPSLSWLDYCLRMLRLRPLDVRHLSSGDVGSRCRVAVVCRAENEPLASGEDTWMRKHWIEQDFQAVSLDYPALASASPAVSCEVDGERLRLHKDMGSAHLFETVRHSKKWTRDASRARLNLADHLDGRPGRAG